MNEIELMKEIIKEDMEAIKEVIKEDIAPIFEHQDKLEKKAFETAYKEVQELEEEL